MGFECVLKYSTPRQQLLNELSEYFGIVIRSRITIDKEILDAATQLKFIARSGSGLENIDVAYAKAKGVEVVNSPEGNRDAVGEHAIAMLLTMLNKIHVANEEVKSGLWHREKNRGQELSAKTIGIIGYGVMGSGLAEKLIGFGCKILAHDKYKTGFGNQHVQEVSMDTLCNEADVLSIHLPLNAETTFYVNDELVEKFKKPFYFINTSRGKNAKTSAIANGISSGKILGACIDVLEYEKASLEGLDFDHMPEDLKYLMNSNKVIITPHVAGWTEESYFKLSNVLADKIEHWLKTAG